MHASDNCSRAKVDKTYLADVFQRHKLTLPTPMGPEIDVFTKGLIVQEILNGIKEKKDRDTVKSD